MFKRLNPSIFSMRLHRLQWRLAFSYALVTTAVFLTTVLLVAFVFFAQDSESSAQQIQEALPPLSSDVLSALVQEPPLTTTLQLWADTTLLREGVLEVASENGGGEGFEFIDTVTILDADGKILVQSKSGGAATSSVTAMADLRTRLQNWADEVPRYINDTPPGITAVAIPIMAHEIAGRENVNNDQRIGFIVVDMWQPRRELLLLFLPLVRDSTILILIFSLITGVVYGYGASRGFVRRLNVLGRAAEQWANGLFDTQAPERPRDEIGDLGGNLNQMVNQLQTLVETRHQLGALNERGRIARELHDTVKQQVFATQMHLSSARLVIEKNPAQAAAILDTAIELNERSQHELVALIHALRPIELGEDGLVNAIEAYVKDWEKQTGIVAEFFMFNERELPFDIEIALYRVMQEALVNIAKHAQAQQVALQLTCADDRVTLRIQDDGEGFNTTEPHSLTYGLKGMRERLHALGGVLEVSSKIGQGSTITAIAPLR